MPVEQQIQQSFSPYTDNGGTTLAIAGEDFCVIAGDTRQSEGYSINTRYAPKVFQLSNNSVLATGGMYADSVALVQRVKQQMELYEHKHAKVMKPGAIAQMLSIMLYHKRFFPYYVWNTLGGVDENGKGCVFSYDPVGNFERRKWQCTGSGGHLIMPFLDNQIGGHHQNLETPPVLSVDQVKRIVKDAFTSATERDIHTGDFLEMFTIKDGSVTKEVFELKKD